MLSSDWLCFLCGPGFEGCPVNALPLSVIDTATCIMHARCLLGASGGLLGPLHVLWRCLAVVLQLCGGFQTSLSPGMLALAGCGGCR